MTRGVRSTAIAMGLLVTLALAGAPQGVAKERWNGNFEFGLPPGSPVEMCDPKTHCGTLEGVSVRDIDVSSEMEGRNESVDYVLKDLSSYLPLTVWRLCKYDGNGQLIDCDERGASWYLWGKLPPRTDSVRVILAQNSNVYWSFRLAI